MFQETIFNVADSPLLERRVELFTVIVSACELELCSFSIGETFCFFDDFSSSQVEDFFFEILDI